MLRKLKALVLVLTLLAIAFGKPAVASAQWGYPYPVYGYSYAAESSLRIEAKPIDAQVYVDGYFAGIVGDFNGTFQRLHVAPGQHEIVIYREGYRSVRERLYLLPNNTRKLTHNLEKLAEGEPNEAPPVPVMQPQPAQDEEDQGQPARQDRRGPPPRQGPPVQPRPAPQTSTGAVVIRVQPDSAEIVIDGEPWAGGSADERLVVQLAAGPHHIEVRKEGYQPVTVDVQVRRGETAPVNISLSRQ